MSDQFNDMTIGEGALIADHVRCIAPSGLDEPGVTSSRQVSASVMIWVIAVIETTCLGHGATPPRHGGERCLEHRFGSGIRNEPKRKDIQNKELR